MFCQFFSVFDSLTKSYLSWKLGQALTPLGRHPCLSLPGSENPSFVYPQRTHHVTGPTRVGFAACNSECVDLKCKGDACCIRHSVHSLQHRAWHTVRSSVSVYGRHVEWGPPTEKLTATLNEYGMFGRQPLPGSKLYQCENTLALSSSLLQKYKWSKIIMTIKLEDGHVKYIKMSL